MSHLNILLAEVLLAQTFMAIYVYLLTYFKKPAAVSKTIWVISAAAILVLNMLIVFLWGYHEAYRKVWIMSLTLPYLIVTTVVSYHKLLQVLFNLLTVMYIACFSVLTGDIAFLLTGKAAYQLMTHILCLSAGLILILRLRSPFLKASELLRKGWGALCCVPLTIVLICLLCISRVTYHGELIFSLIAYTSLAAGACVYYMIYRFFIKVLEEQQSAHFENLLKLRARSAEEDIRISEESKSTISHYRSVISSFMQDLEDDVSSGLDINESLKQLSGCIEQLKSIRPPVYCSHQLINTVLRAYNKQAEKYDIDMDINVDLTERFDINETEFAVVLSNALNNAVDACLALSENEPRSISVRLTSRSGQIAAKITNTFNGNVAFDDNHIPVSERGQGHGMGTRSMNTFAVNNGGTLDFSCEGSMFTVRLLV